MDVKTRNQNRHRRKEEERQCRGYSTRERDPMSRETQSHCVDGLERGSPEIHH